MIPFPNKPDLTTMEAVFDLHMERVYKVKLVKTINGGSAYRAELLTEGVDEKVKEHIEAFVVAEAKKQGVFTPQQEK